MVRIRRRLLSALTAGTAGLAFPLPAAAHPLTGGPVTGPQAAVLAAALALALAGWAMISRGGARLSRPGYALLLAGVVIFVAGPDLAVTIAHFGAPATRTRLVLVTPVEGQVLPSSEVPISARLFRPARAGWTPLDPAVAGGRLRIAVDGRPQGTTSVLTLMLRVPPGPHVVTVEYVTDDGRAFWPPVLATRRITAAPPAPAATPVGDAAAAGGLPPFGWGQWNADPVIVASLALTVAAYLWAVRRFRPRRWQPVCFWGGVLALAAALVSPIDAGAEYLFAMHMAQHMLLLLVAPPLLALAVPPALLGRLYQMPRIASALRALWAPVPAFIAFNGVLVFWHLPFAYDATLTFRWMHALEHLSFVAAGMVFWGVIVSPAPKLVQASFGLRLGLVVAADIVNFLVGFALAFAGRPFYRHYTEVPRLWGLSPLDDLHLGGVVMWTMGQMMYVIPVLILLNVLLRRDDGGGSRPAVAAAAPNGAARGA